MAEKAFFIAVRLAQLVHEKSNAFVLIANTNQAIQEREHGANQ